MLPIKHVRLFALALAASPWHAGWAQLLCAIPEAVPELEAQLDLDGDAVEVLFGRITASIDGGAEFGGNVEIRYRDQRFMTDSARYDRTENAYDFDGRVTYSDSEVSVFSENGHFDSDTGLIRFGNSGFELQGRSARGSAASIEISDVPERIALTDTLFTTCPMEAMAWRLVADDVELSVDEGVGTARGMKLKFGRVPLIYTPYFTFPLNDERKSGFLTPNIAERDRTGLYLSIPYYLNLAPNYDLVIEPRYLSKRGLQVRNEFRYLLERSEGQFNFETLPQDRAADDESRSYVNLEHETVFGSDGNWRVVAMLEEVSDAAYFEDLGNSLSVTSQTHLNRYLDIGYLASNWSLLTRFQNYQTIDTVIADVDRPYERVPQMLFEGSWFGNLLQFDSNSELVNFERSVGTTGWRLDATQELSLRLRRSGMFLTPAVAWRQTNYWLDGVEAGGDDAPARGLAVTSLDSGLLFERLVHNGETIQTLEPRVLYVNIPFEDQSDLPVFDTIMPDFNLVQLFRKYQFVGPDRISDTDQVSVGITTRVVEAASGRERLSATLGRTRYMSAQRVSLPDQVPIETSASDYLARLTVSVSPTWNLDLGYQWNSETDLTARTETRFEYRPQSDRVFGLGYRYRRDLVEQGDLSLVWPISDRWRVIGRYSYSLLENAPLEQFVGWEYDACCWRLRVVGRQYVSRRTGETDTAISFQLELKGLSSASSAPEELLDRGILGYGRRANETQL